MNMKKLASVLVIAYGSCAYMWYQGSQGNDTLGFLGYGMAMGLVYVTVGLVVGFAGTLVYKFGRWLAS